MVFPECLSLLFDLHTEYISTYLFFSCVLLRAILTLKLLALQRPPNACQLDVDYYDSNFDFTWCRFSSRPPTAFILSPILITYLV